VIDDVIFPVVFVGNDFLSDLHIHENGMERLLEVYKTIIVKMGGCLPLFLFFFHLHSLVVEFLHSPFPFLSFASFSPDVTTFVHGYINEAGTINAWRLQLVLDQMAIWEHEVFE
jgi:5'-3' exoribonuclease 1